ncbi:pkd domain containing protein [Ichthyobacterium seriolicida]|uniref:Pkd domain containing protein n=1 Tax=Ichthyobacterium seriolicida TaxID=242600 RepID=A0A1J1EC01_9FLAO|nr:pkd domain containing protein [Ichthyobacterium seriolicida]
MFSFVFLLVFFSSCKNEKREVDLKSSEKFIKSFKFLDSDNEGKYVGENLKITIDSINYRISITVAHNAILKGLKPKIDISDKASISPSSGEEVDFEFILGPNIYQKIFKVTAEDGSFENYTVNITKSLSTNFHIHSFKLVKDINGDKGLITDVHGVIDSNNLTISFTLPSSTVLTGLKPSIDATVGVLVNPADQYPLDFTSGESVRYIVTAQDGAKKIYQVRLIKEDTPVLTSFTISPNTSKGISSNVVTTVSNLNDGTGTILLKFPKEGTNDINLAGLAPTVIIPEGHSLSPTSGSVISEDISNKTFTLTKTDTGSKRTYTVKAVKGPYIETFKFTSSDNTANGITVNDVTGIIDHSAGTIKLVVPSTVDLDQNLTPTITVANAVNITGSAQSFASAITYTVTSNDTSATDFTKVYTVTVTKEAVPQLTVFTIGADTNKGIQNEVSAEFTHPSSDNTGIIKLKFPKNNEHAFDLTGLSYTSEPGGGYTLTPASPLTGQSIHGQTFTLTKTDTGSKRTYTVKAVKGPYIETFKFAAAISSGGSSTNTGITADVTGVIDHAQSTIKLVVPSAVDLNTAELTPTITVANAVNITGSAQSFASAVTFTITSDDTSVPNFTKEYTVTVTK